MRRKRPLEYWLQRLRDTNNDYIVISDDVSFVSRERVYEVAIGDCATHSDYWEKQPYAWATHKDLKKAIEKAIEGYEASQRQFLVNELKE